MAEGKCTVAMVDVYAPTMRLAKEFIRQGHDCVRVQSTLEVPPVYRAGFTVDDFADNIVHDGNLDKTLRAVTAHRPVIVAAGGELGVELADQLSEALALPTNGSGLSEARRNKFVQIETVRCAGLRAPRQLLVHEDTELSQWHRNIGEWIVVKPIRSAGNDGVFFCRTPAEAVEAYRALVNRINVFANRNEGVVAQELLEGPEYIVNSVSRNGSHRATDVWKYTKISVNGVRERINGALTVPPDDQVWAVLVDYAFAVLDSLGVLHGPAHLEIILTSEGPCIVELGARLCGADTAYYASLAGGESQVERTVEAYLRPQQFLTSYRAPHRLDRHVAMAFLNSPVEGVLRSYPLLPAVESLESFHDLHVAVKPGDRLRRTVDDSSEPLMIGLAHPNAAVVIRDLNTITYLDGHGFYDLEPHGGDL